MCWYCGEAVRIDGQPGRSERCTVCGKDLRCCKACRFYLPGSRSDCAESSAEPVIDKERGNFCDYFQMDPRFKSANSGEKNKNGKAADPKAAFDALFG